MNYKYICQQSEVDRLLPTLMEKDTWAMDTETTGLNPNKDKVLLLQIGTEEIQYVLDTRKVHVEPLRPFFESKSHRKIMHNGKFDYKMIKGNFGIDTEIVRDTYLAEKIINNGRKFGGFGLDDLVKAHLGITLPKDVRSTFGQGKVPEGDFTTDQIEYAAADVKHLIPLLTKQVSFLKNDGVADIWILECNVLPCFADMEFYGMYLEKEGWTKLINLHTEEAAKAEKELNEIAANVVQRDLFGEVHVNWASPDQVVAVLRNLKVKVKVWDRLRKEFVEMLINKSDDKTLKRAKDLPVIKLLKKYRSHNIRVTTFGQSYLDAVCPVTGRLHPDIEQLGTETGRPANRSKKGSVNLLNIPRDKAYRNCFKGEEYEVVETDDYSGCELRIWAELSGDPHLSEAFRKGIDVHCYVASMLFGEDVQKGNPLRTPAKTLNFGIAYAMSAMSLYEKLNAEGYPIELGPAKRLYYDYCEKFDTGIRYLRGKGREGAERGYLCNQSGRRRYWIKPNAEDLIKYPNGETDDAYLGRLAGIEREGGNFPIQSVNADMTKTAMIMIRDYIKKNGIRSKFMNQVYDEIVTRTHKDDSPAFHEAKKKIMIEAAQMFLKKIPMEVDGHVGSCWTK